jgi:hypothetical protein
MGVASLAMISSPYAAAGFSRLVRAVLGRCAIRHSSWQAAIVVSQAGGAYSSGIPALRRPSI